MNSDPKPSRREVVGMAPALAIAAEHALSAQSQSTGARPFQVRINDEVIQRILSRVKETRFPDRLDATDWRYGIDWNYMRDLAAYWSTQFNWRTAEENLNRYPQFMARVGDYDIHFYHVKRAGAGRIPLVLTHGWPGSVFEFLEVIGPLSEDFDIVVPSLPGFGFSSKPPGKPIGPPTTARLWHALMTEVLGYQKYGAQGGDWGNSITTQLARQFPNSLVGIHLNAAGGAAQIPEAELTDELRAWQRAAAAYRGREIDYFNEQTNKPQTVAFALADNPVGTAAWIAEKMKVWSDSSDNLDATFTKDQVLTNVMIYLVTDTAATGIWFYRGNADDPPATGGKISVPTGFASFPKEMPLLNPPQAVLERSYNVVQYTKMPRGGHFAALEQPQLFVEDVRRFFRAR
jgi:pimeloyl-ACP methyl ester carboxylesterase